MFRNVKVIGFIVLFGILSLDSAVCAPNWSAALVGTTWKATATDQNESATVTLSFTDTECWYTYFGQKITGSGSVVPWKYEQKTGRVILGAKSELILSDGNLILTEGGETLVFKREEKSNFHKYLAGLFTSRNGDFAGIGNASTFEFEKDGTVKINRGKGVFKSEYRMLANNICGIRMWGAEDEQVDLFNLKNDAVLVSLSAPGMVLIKKEKFAPSIKSLSGLYKPEKKGLIESIEFDGEGTCILIDSFVEIRQACQYRIQGNKVLVTDPTGKVATLEMLNEMAVEGIGLPWEHEIFIKEK